MNTAFDTLIFDLGGVLIDWNPRYLYRSIFEDEQEMEAFLSEVCTPDWNEQQDAGRPAEEATRQKIAERPEYESAIRAYYGRWPEMLGGPIEGTVKLLQQLRARQQYRIYALTNWSHETWPVAWEQYDFLRWFEGILVSGQEKMKKPDPRIYQLLLERYAIQPGSALFIDDNLRNVEAAQKLGINALRFQSPETLGKTLQQMKILV